jgi:hypothetical protein
MPIVPFLISREERSDLFAELFEIVSEMQQEKPVAHASRSHGSKYENLFISLI